MEIRNQITSHIIARAAVRQLGLFAIALLLPFLSWAQTGPLRVGVAGLTHGHVHWVFQSAARGDIKIVGIAEEDASVVAKYAEQYGLSMDLYHPSLEDMLHAVTPEAVVAFGSIKDHLEVVQKCAPKGIHVMVEKPLAVSLSDAEQMRQLADEHQILLLTNYETTWYPTHHKAYEMIWEDTVVGPVRKLIVRDGHRGPKKIGVSPEFLKWLTDHQLNGGGAVTDFGCYGANLATWFLKGERPTSVTAVTQQLQPENNPMVDDEANMILTYPRATVIIQASWNWPIGRKDMEIHGLCGSVIVDNRNEMRVRIAEGYDGFEEKSYTLDERPSPLNDPFLYLTSCIRDGTIMGAYALSSIENNMIVMEILDAARRSAALGKTILLDNK